MTSVAHAPHRLHALRDAVLDLVLPRACAVCERVMSGHERGHVCGRCWIAARPLPGPRCSRCGHPQRPPIREGVCRWCEHLPKYVRAARSAYWVPGGTAGRIVHALKYAGWRGVAVEMADRMARLDWPRDVVEERAAVVPVPLAPARERERGFNQSALLAHALGARWGVPAWANCIERVRATSTQTRLTPESRRANVFGAFRASPGAPAALQGAHVVLVDDVITTGATTAECAAALFAGGARIVSIVTFGRAPHLGDRP